MTEIVFDPHGDEKVTMPFLFLTAILKPAMLLPETLLIPGAT